MISSTLLVAILLLGGCSITLDPTVSRDDGATTPLAVCSVFESETREYELCAEPLAWSAAEHDCRLRGAGLVSIESEAENTLVWDAAQTVGTNLWLSGTRDDELVWTWATEQIFWQGGPDGAAPNDAYVRWAPDEPNDSSTVSRDPERCLALTLGEADWNDRVCSLLLPYVCERALHED